MGFHQAFQRTRNQYLAFWEAGLRAGCLDVYQWTFAPTRGYR